jgi:fatty-acyl-CoA synthase
MAQFTFDPLTPTRFLSRSAQVYKDQTAVVDGPLSYTYEEFADRSARLAGGLAARGVTPGDRIAALCANGHELLELHHGVAWASATLVPLNPRLTADELSHIVRHSGAALLVATTEYDVLAREVAGACRIEAVVGPQYEALVAAGEPLVADNAETDLLAINYTSGTTGDPKGVMYHHRGAYLQALAMVHHAGLSADTRYLWTLPMFHCNGWSFVWALTAAGGTHVCQRRFDAAGTWQAIASGGATHLCAAPTVLTMIAEAARAVGVQQYDARLRVMTGGAPPTPTLLAALERLGIEVTHLYGMTETYGPFAINEWRPSWDAHDPVRKAVLRARQGVGNIISTRMRIVDDQGQDVPNDGETVGEIVVRGNNVMLGYYRDEEATARADLDGWLRTGDLAVMHPDYYIEIRDRVKDLIISGGENISSLQVEAVLNTHPSVIESAVVAREHPVWGEVPVAFVETREDVTPDDLITHARSHLAGFKVPKEVLFEELPRTSTGKIAKASLRQRLR